MTTARRTPVSKQIRAAAIADLQAGEQPVVVAQRYGLDPAQMRVWKQRYVTETVTPGTPVVIRPSIERAQLDIADLVLRNLEAKLIATQRIAEHVANNQEWISRQSAAELGELFEHIDRSAIAILDRMAGRSHADEQSRSAGLEATARPANIGSDE